MKNIGWLALGGLLMLVVGGLMMFSNSGSLPLWATWFAGPLLWYLGFGIAIGGLAAHFFIPTKHETDEQTVPVLKLERVGRQNAPKGISREIPAMGGFIL